MHKILFALCALLSLRVASEVDFDSFSKGLFLGSGSYVTSTKDKGDYVSFAKIEDDKWDLAYVRPFGKASFSLSFTFIDNGIFSVLMTERLNNAEGNDKNHAGYGFCSLGKCHMHVDMGDRTLEESFWFSESGEELIRFGTLRKILPDKSSIIIAWSEKLSRFF
jgi:hypothetical protein